MVLNKPPIVEIWFEFEFNPSPNRTVENAVNFLNEYDEEFTEIEVSKSERLEFKQTSPTALPKVVGRKIGVEHIRAHNPDESRWLHLTSNKLVCNFVRLGDSYPGFDQLTQEAVSKLERYVEICEPVGLESAAIHYVDVIEIPVPDSGEIFLKDYFRIGVDLPKDPFGDQISFSIQMVMRSEDGSGDLEIQMQSEPLKSQSSVYRFRVDWHKIIDYKRINDDLDIRKSLSLAHQSVKRCFREIFTKQTWELFDPSE